MTKQHKKVILIGDGAVGSSYAFALVNQGIAQELGIVDILQLLEKLMGMQRTLVTRLHSLHLRKFIQQNMLTARDADLVVMTAGAPQKPGETRLDWLEKPSHQQSCC